MSDQIMRDRTFESLKEAGAWPEADRGTLVPLATIFAATGADAEGLAYFEKLASQQPDRPLLTTLAGFFGVRAGLDIPTALARLDEAATKDLGLPQYYRGLALAGLPAEAGRASQAVADLEFILAVRDQLPASMIRAVRHGLAAAQAALGDDDTAGRAAAESGLPSAPPGARLEFGGFWADAAEGFHFAAPRIIEPAPGVRVAQGYDFGDFAFLTTSEGTVVIDAGTAPHRVAAALADAGLQADQVSHVILTHAHFDHAGGIAALLGPGPQVITQAGFPAELARQRDNAVPFRYFLGRGAGFGSRDGADPPVTITPTRLIAEPTPLTIGGVNLVLHPVTGGETSDALMVELPEAGVLFTGDVMMPYLGAPFFAEGSPEGLLEAVAYISGLHPRRLIHGHVSLTDVFTVEAIAGLLPALTELHERALEGIHRGLTVTGLLDQAWLPDVLRDHAPAVAPYLVIRDHFVQRLHRQHTGYWQADGEGIEPVSPAQRAAALDLLAGGSPEPFARAAATLIGQRDHVLALELVTAGLARHPGDQRLAQLRQEALYRLMERHQLQDPFKFLIYAELAGAEMGPAA